MRGKEQWKRRGQLQEFNNAMHPRHLEVRELAKPPNLPLEERFARNVLGRFPQISYVDTNMMETRTAAP